MGKEMSLHESFEPTRSVDLEQLGGPGASFRLETVRSIAEDFLRRSNALPTGHFQLEVVPSDRFPDENEHFAFDGKGHAIFRDSMFERVQDDLLLFSSLIVHELYHNVQHGFGSYGEAIELIKSFNVTDIVRADLEADLATFQVVSEHLNVEFEDYCRTVMLRYSDLFGPQNKGFADFSRFCGKAFTITQQIGEHDVAGAVVFLSPNENGWKREGAEVHVDCQIVRPEGIRFNSIVLPAVLHDKLQSMFWGGAYQLAQERTSLSAAENHEHREELVATLLETVEQADLLR